MPWSEWKKCEFNACTVGVEWYTEVTVQFIGSDIMVRYEFSTKEGKAKQKGRRHFFFIVHVSVCTTKGK